MSSHPTPVDPHRLSQREPPEVPLPEDPLPPEPEPESEPEPDPEPEPEFPEPEDPVPEFEPHAMPDRGLDRGHGS